MQQYGLQVLLQGSIIRSCSLRRQDSHVCTALGIMVLPPFDSSHSYNSWPGGFWDLLSVEAMIAFWTSCSGPGPFLSPYCLSSSASALGLFNEYHYFSHLLPASCQGTHSAAPSSVASWLAQLSLSSTAQLLLALCSLASAKAVSLLPHLLPSQVTSAVCTTESRPFKESLWSGWSCCTREPAQKAPCSLTHSPGQPEPPI